jgi:hypothetical protein
MPDAADIVIAFEQADLMACAKQFRRAADSSQAASDDGDARDLANPSCGGKQEDRRKLNL